MTNSRRCSGGINLYCHIPPAPFVITDRSPAIAALVAICQRISSPAARFAEQDVCGALYAVTCHTYTPCLFCLRTLHLPARSTHDTVQTSIRLVFLLIYMSVNMLISERSEKARHVDYNQELSRLSNQGWSQC